MQTKEEIAKEVQDELSKAFAAFGYEILQALVTDIDPDPRVKAAMNEVSGQQLKLMMTCAAAMYCAGCALHACIPHPALQEGEQLCCTFVDMTVRACAAFQFASSPFDFCQ